MPEPRGHRDVDAKGGADLPSEFELTARYFAPLSRGFPGAYELRDDAAVIMPAPGCELVVKTDVIVAGIDFTADTPPDVISRKALRVNLSHLAAKRGVPRAYPPDLLLPRDIDEPWIANFAEGLSRDQALFGVHLIGGDTSSTYGPIVVAVRAFREVHTERILRRE